MGQLGASRLEMSNPAGRRILLISTDKMFFESRSRMSFSFSFSNPAAGFALLVSLLLCTSAPLPVQAHEDDTEIELLRQQILDLQKRVERLEGEVEQGVPSSAAQALQPLAGGWRKAHNWKVLAEGMTAYRVKEVLGEPERQKTVKNFEFWYYGDGKVRLYLRRLKSWDLPSGLDSE